MVACICLLLTSCGASRQVATNSNIANTNVVLAHKNYKVIGTVRGESTQNYFFGIGGLSKQSMNQSAMADMYKNAELEGKPRAVINVNVVLKSKGIFFYNQAKCIATGTVIEFID